MNIKWTEIEKQFIRENADKIFDDKMAEQLSILSGRKVTVAAIRKQRTKLKIKKKCGRGLCQICP